MREKTITEVMREPIVSYTTIGFFDGDEQAWAYEEEAEAVDAARMMESGGATQITVERLIIRVVQDREELNWRE